jgi:hypothetical protein
MHPAEGKGFFRGLHLLKAGSITLVAMYTLKRGDDGRLHGPLNKQVWGSYAPRKVMLAWARRHATKRGFPPGTDKRIHIVLDGETCLHDGLAVLYFARDKMKLSSTSGKSEVVQSTSTRRFANAQAGV